MNTSDGTYADSKQTVIGSNWAEDERWALALRIASGRQLFKANQLREILLYLCQRVLSDPATVIREHEIGCNVLGRRADFNPNDDNIVRVQISHLRKKLDEYFSTDGAAELLILTIPKGSYVPRFAARVQRVLDADATVTVIPPPVQPVPVKPAASPRWWLWPLCGLLTVLLIVGIVSLYRRPNALDVKREHAADNLIWSSIFNPVSPPSIVVADTCLVMLQDTLGTDISLADYIGGQYPDNLLSKVSDEPLRKSLTTLASRQYTSLGDVDIASGLMELSSRLGATGSIHYARHLNIRNFQSGNFVLIGSRRGNPWVGLFEQQLNFSLNENPQTHRFYFHNKDARPGEAADYLPVLNGNNVLESYADIAFVPNLGKTGYVLILSGITMEASEAAGQLLMRQDFPPSLNKIVQTANLSASPKSLEILIRVRSLGGAASNSEILTSRIH